jgi:hypothetical protein
MYFQRVKGHSLILEKNFSFLPHILQQQHDTESPILFFKSILRHFWLSFNHSTKDLDYSNRLHSFIVQPDDSHSLPEKF